MTRTIKASEVKPGMEIEFSIPHRMKVYTNIEGDNSKRELGDISGSIKFVDADTPVTVLAEAQPEEPTAGGARVVVDGRRFLRADDDSLPWVELEVWDWHNWDSLCELGTVKVIPDPGWEVPADGESTPEVPDRIEKWPEDDTALRDHKWRDVDGDVWQYGVNIFGDGWHRGGMLWSQPSNGPWTRVTAPDSTPAVPGQIEKWPEDDTALRDHKWRGHLGNTWTWFGPGRRWECRNTSGNYVGSYPRPTDAPFTCVARCVKEN